MSDQTEPKSYAGVMDHALHIAEVALYFGQVERATQHPDGRPESDATHTLMLALIALELAPPELDRGKLLAAVIVHDLPEWHPSVQDTNTAWGLSEYEREAKASRERWAVERLRDRGLHSIVALIEDYERQDSPESRWVRYVDKVMPKLTHLLNGGAALRAIGMTRADMLEKHAEQGRELQERYPEQDHARMLFDAACRRCESTLLREGEG